ncbi:hypothetical protein DFH94DRAFT_687740 [Russula ochroleuca]|uniref:Uncharacterized protein n=1 Tax=Russula ochroleuca TaxID=152965 RepID=A0A9P5N5U9_9AGAM|nr:hypothetical protein DFH94DRAFT_687740 [Russula ochroleuca]
MATFLVGSLSRLLILNGVSSKDVAATVGRSGSVVIAPSFKNPWLPGDRMADFCFWQVYSLSRVAALMAVISTLVLLNLSTPYNCQLSVNLAILPSYVALAAASFLLVLRIAAIWNKNLVAVVIATVVWAVDGGFLIDGKPPSLDSHRHASDMVLRYASELSEAPGVLCEPVNIQTSKATMIVACVADVVLLIIMFVGLLRLGCHRHRTQSTGRFLWNQGIIWLLLATVTGVLPTVFVCLNLNEPLGIIFRYPWTITMTIAATRMYRGLDDFFTTDIGRKISVRGTPAVPIPLDGVGIALDVYTTHTQSESLTSQAIPPSMCSSMDGQPLEKSHGLV